MTDCPHRVETDDGPRCMLKAPSNWPEDPETGADMVARWRMCGGSADVFGECESPSVCPVRIDAEMASPKIALPDP